MILIFDLFIKLLLCLIGTYSKVAYCTGGVVLLYAVNKQEIFALYTFFHILLSYIIVEYKTGK